MELKRILIINFFGIGDVLFTTPLLENIKLNIPDASIGYLTSSRALAVLKNNPHINRIFIYDREEFVQVARRSRIAYWRKGWELLSAIKKENYDAVIDLSLNGYMSFLMALAGIHKRVGFNYKNRSAFLTQKIELKGYDDKHVVDYYLDLLGRMGLKIHSQKLEFSPSVEDKLWAEEQIKKNLDIGKPIIALVPGGGASWGKDSVYKRWSGERYAQLADKIVENYDAQIILLGDSSEKELCQNVIRQMKRPVFSFVGNTTLGQMAALLQRSLAAVVNDGGPLHVAVAVGIKTVSVFGPVDERVYGPYPSQGHRVVAMALPCRPCYRQFRRANCPHMSCLGQITIDDVLRNLNEILTQQSYVV